MKALLINGSPKAQSSNSGYLLELIRRRLPQAWEFSEYKVIKSTDYAAALAQILACDVLVLAFPLYVDSLPSHLLDFLAQADAALQNKTAATPTHVYAAVNCGFYEGSQNVVAVEIVKNWAQKCGLVWGQTLMTGGGEMLGSTRNVPMGRGPNKNIGRALEAFTANIAKGVQAGDICINPSFPRRLFIFMANRFWVFKVRKNGLRKRDLFAR